MVAAGPHIAGSGKRLAPSLRYAAALLLAATVALAAGCGFQLRGAPPVPAALQPLHVACQEAVPVALCQRVKTQLDQGGIELADAETAAYQLRLDRFQESRRASAISLDASAAEYDLRQTVSVSIISADDIPVLAGAEVRSSEIYSYDDTNVLAKRREEATLRDQLYTRLAQQVVFRMAPYSEERLQQARKNYLAEQKAREEQGEQRPLDTGQ